MKENAKEKRQDNKKPAAYNAKLEPKVTVMGDLLTVTGGGGRLMMDLAGLSRQGEPT